MNQNFNVDEELQKAIDDITKTTSVDPMFSDPVAASSTVPEGDTGEIGEIVAPINPDGAKIEVEPEAYVQDAAMMVQEPSPIEATGEPVSFAEPVKVPVPTFEVAPATEAPIDIHQVKESALRDILPLLKDMHINPLQKFNIYRDAFELLHDYTVLKEAYAAAKELSDEDERAEALLYIIEAIDRM